ncbi:MAG: hypothetical protein PF442_02975 [Desulfobulbaceae bacterium]|nr:hypothetical protein [Desulfobulbaceae bacterium]
MERIAPGITRLILDNRRTSAFSECRLDAIKQYEVFVARGRNQPPVWEQLKKQIYLGSELFVDEMHCKLSVEVKSTEIACVQRRQLAKSLESYMQKYTDRNLAIFKAYERGTIIVCRK